MKVSDLTADFLADYIKTDKTIQSEINLITMLKESAINYFCNVTGLEEFELDEDDDITLAIMILVQDSYDNRAMYVESTNVNRTVQGIIDAHRRNFL